MHTRPNPSSAKIHTPTGEGFTLVELLIVTAIMGLVIGVIGSALAAGIKVWDNVLNEMETSRAQVAMLAMERKLCNAFPIASKNEKLHFTGKADSISFTSRQISDKKEIWLRNTFKTSATSKSLLAVEEDATTAASDIKQNEHTLFDSEYGIGLHFRYCTNTMETDIEKWPEQTTNYPFAVTIDLTILVKTNSISLSQTVPLQNLRLVRMGTEAQ